MKKTTAAILGAGQIGAFFDSPAKRDRVLTHAHAYSAMRSRVTLAAFYDADIRKAKAAAQRWGGKPYSNLNRLLKEIRPDIVSVCTPDATHSRVLSSIAAVSHKPKLIFSEKPLNVFGPAYKRLRQSLKGNRTTLTVNYTRRWSPEFAGLKKRIDRNEFGPLTKGICFYTGTLMHNGVHAVDLFQWYLGPVKSWTRSKSARTQSPDVCLEFSSGQNVQLISVPNTSYSVFDIQLFFEKAAVLISQTANSITFYKSASHPVYPGRFRLVPAGVREKVFFKPMLHAMTGLLDFMDGKAKLPLSLSEVQAVENLCRKIVA